MIQFKYVMSYIIFTHNMSQQSKANTIVHSLKKIQFIAEFFILSKVSDDSHIVSEFLMIVESIRFYFKTVAFVEAENLYLEYPTPKAVNEDKEGENGIPKSIKEAVEMQKKLLDKIKKKPYQIYDNYPNFHENLPNGKKIQLITCTEIPSNLKKSTMSLKHTIGEILTLIRPLISIIAIRIFGPQSYKSYFASLIIDIIIITFFQRGLKVINNDEKGQIKDRRLEVLKRYFFRKPFFDLIKSLMIVPLMKKIIREDRLVFGLIISLLDMQSSISLTL